MAIKAFNSSGRGSLSSVLQSMEYVRQAKIAGQNVRLINASFGFVGAKFPTLDAIIAQLGEAGVFVVAAAGNSKQDNDRSPTYPASSPGGNVLAVAAVDSDANLASFSNFGATSVDIAAPGVSIYSLYPNGKYARMSGTSMATPFVAGSLALLLEQAPNASMAAIRSALLDGASQFDTLKGVVAESRFLNIPAALSLLPKAPVLDDEDAVTEPPSDSVPPPAIVPTPVPTIAPTPTPNSELGKDKKKKAKKKAKKKKKTKLKKKAKRS